MHPTDQPSTLLKAERGVVTFQGREAERADLRKWRNNSDHRLAARLLHGPGGQGKTRLAAQFAAESRATGLEVVWPLPGQPGRLSLPKVRTKTLVVVDYADRLPWDDIQTLVADLRLATDHPIRVLLLARSTQSWPALRGRLSGDAGAITDEMSLTALADTSAERLAAFNHARDCFAEALGIDGVADLAPPGPLDHPEMGLALSLHMAALVAVDAHARGVDTPSDPTALSEYLLDREESHCIALAEGTGRFRTAPINMRRTVFTACLTGARPYSAAHALVAAHAPAGPDTLLEDHALCYPPSPQPSWDELPALEPLYPDRLAEDFIARCLPGGTHAQGWAVPALNELLARDTDGIAPPYVDRAVTFLAATSAPGRNPHVAHHLAALLRADPRLAYDAGTPTLLSITHLDAKTLATVVDEAPFYSDPRVDVGAFVLSETVTTKVSVRDLPGPMLPSLGKQYLYLGMQAKWAGAPTKAGNYLRKAVELLAAGTAPEDSLELATALSELSDHLFGAGDQDEGYRVLAQAVAIVEEFVALNPDEHHLRVVQVLATQANRAVQTGELDLALALYDRLVPLAEELPEPERTASLASTLTGRGTVLLAVKQFAEALVVLERAVRCHRDFQRDHPHAFETGLASTLSNLSACCSYLGRDDEAAAYNAEAAAIGTEVNKVNPASERIGGLLLLNQVVALAAAGEFDSAIALVTSAVATQRDQRGAHPDQDTSPAEALMVLSDVS